MSDSVKAHFVDGPQDGKSMNLERAAERVSFVPPVEETHDEKGEQVIPAAAYALERSEGGEAWYRYDPDPRDVADPGELRIEVEEI